MYTCRECERPINQATELCPYCGADLTAAGTPQLEEPAKKRSFASIVLRWGVLLAALWGFLWFILPERSGDPLGQAEARAIAALREVREALATYAAAQGGSYPPSLEVLEGFDARATSRRVREAARNAQSEGYHLQYFAGPPAADGVVRGYALLARPGNYGYRNFYTDETGVIRATRENRPATAEDLPI